MVGMIWYLQSWGIRIRYMSFAVIMQFFRFWKADDCASLASSKKCIAIRLNLTTNTNDEYLWFLYRVCGYIFVISELDLYWWRIWQIDLKRWRSMRHRQKPLLRIKFYRYAVMDVWMRYVPTTPKSLRDNQMLFSTITRRLVAHWDTKLLRYRNFIYNNRSWYLKIKQP